MQLYDDLPPDYGEVIAAPPFRWMPGKSGPRLIKDLAQHALGSSWITDFPKDNESAEINIESHAWVIDLPNDQTWDETTKKLSACCEKTRVHLEIQVDYDAEAQLRDHCQARELLHHFQCLQDQTIRSKAYEEYTWSCSRCPTRLQIKLRAPELSDLTLQNLYKVRPKATYSNTSVASKNITEPSRFSTLMGVEYFIRNTINFQASPSSGVTPREIEYKQGSTFARLVGMEAEVTAFLQDCMFRLAPGDWNRESWYDEKDLAAEMQDGIEWAYFPADPRKPGVRERLQRLRLEVQILAFDARSSLGDPHRNRTWLVKHERAESCISKLLDVEARLYQSPHSIQKVDDPKEESSYRQLGIIYEFRDDVVAEFAQLQIKHNTKEQSIYLSALETIASARRSDILIVEVQKQKSLGAYSLSDLRAAYKLLGEADPADDDETILNLAASFMLDDDVEQHKLRNALDIIGKERNSRVIRKYLDTPEKEFGDIDAALTYLGAEGTTDDDFLMILYNMKKDDNATLATAALELIADERKNVRLRRFLETGETDPIPTVRFKDSEQPDLEMLDPDLAYSRLGIDDRSIDDDMLITLFEIRQLDEPDAAAQLRQALALLGDTRNSAIIKSYVDTGSKTLIIPHELPPASSERPVGLENIGNTCYLNSLLQYYFTVKPLRDLLLQVDRYIEQELSNEVMSRKKVGGRLVTREEVERALRFVRELKTLFQTLISSRSSSVRPSKNLCFLALVSQRDEQLQTSSSVLDKTKGADLIATETNALVSVTTAEATVDEVTLSTEGQLHESPNLAVTSNMNELIQKPPSDSLLMEAEDHATKRLKVDDVFGNGKTCATATDLIDAAPMINRPEKARKLSILETDSSAWGKQQDVAECIDNCLFQIEAALRPSTLPSEHDNEQQDLIKDLFYGSTLQKLDIVNNVAKLERFSNTIVTLERDGQDVYQALDGVFEERLVELDGKPTKLSLTIVHAPPILQIQVQRAAFDMKTMSAIKSNVYLALDRVLYLDRYMETEDADIPRRRQEYWHWKRELQSIMTKKTEIQNMLDQSEISGPSEQEKHSAVVEAIEIFDESDSEGIVHIEHADLTQSSAVSEVAVVMPASSPSVAMDIDQPNADELRTILRATEAEQNDLVQKLTTAFESDRQHEYCLQSVFIHRGEASHGHYWIYIYDFQLDKWRKYNDEEVTDVSKEEIYKNREASNENPYMLTYIRRDSLDIMAPLERDFERTFDAESFI